MKTNSVVVTVGTFDGVHLGHQAILQRVSEIAHQKKIKRVAYAFTLPPRLSVLQPTQQEQPDSCLLLPPLIKLKLLQRYVDRVDHANFIEVRDLSAERFIREILIEQLAARAIVVGESFRFGRRREGDLPLLHRIGKEQGLLVVAVSPVLIGQTVVSSTQIRTLIATGEVAEARVLLGRPPLLFGRVIEGDRIGRRLGYPTANLALDQTVLHPGRGVYLVHAFWPGKESPGLLYIGLRPTLKGSTVRCEVHLLSPPNEELYETMMEVHLLQKLRDDRTFPSLRALRHQMGRDVDRARSLLLSYDGAPRSILV